MSLRALPAAGDAKGQPLISSPSASDEESEAQRPKRFTRGHGAGARGAGNPARLGRASTPGWTPHPAARRTGAPGPVARAQRGPRAQVGAGEQGGRRSPGRDPQRGAGGGGAGGGGARGGSARGGGSDLHPGRAPRPRPAPARPSPCLALPPGTLRGTSSRREAHTWRFLSGAAGRRPAGGCGREPGPPRPPAPWSQRPGSRCQGGGGRRAGSAARAGPG